MMAYTVDDIVGIGLRTRNPADRVALRGVRLRSRLTALCERTTIEQTFVNAEPRAIEAVYTFPLPDGAAVCGFEVVTGDRVLTGVVEESNRAIAQYENAISDGDGAFLMEQERADVFTIRVGNVKPRQAATVRISYARALARADRTIRIAFPTTVAPRYVTDSGGRDPIEAGIDGDAVNPPHVLHVPYGLSVDVEIDLGRGVREITSPSHAIHEEPTNETRVRRVTLTGGITEMNRDVVIALEMAKDEKPAVQVGRWTDGKPFLAVTFMPEFDVDELAHPPAPSEVVFMLDCSGSMQGESIEQAQNALELCLRSLGEGDTFNLCRFGSTFELMAPEPVPYHAHTMRQAVRQINRGADLGGTELLAPLEAILRLPPRPGTVRQIILLTDGQISNEAEVIALARAHADRCRIFTFGIGAAASASLVNGLARATRGAAEFIAVGERIEDKVLRTFGRLASPQVTDVELDFNGADVQTLASIPPVFDGDALAVYGRVLGRLPSEVTLRCNSRTGPKSWTLPVPDMRHDGGAIALMFARRAIQSFEDVNAVRRPVYQETPTRDEAKLIALSKEFGLLCSLTTFVAIEHRTPAERNEGRPALRRVPVLLAEGWGGVEPAAGGMLLDCLVSRSSAAPAAAPSSIGTFSKGKRGRKHSNNTIDKTMDRTIDRLRDSLDKPIDRDLYRSIDRDDDDAIDIATLTDAAADSASDGPIGKLVDTLIREAVSAQAGEVHVEPLADHGRVRFRVNGTLVERDRLPLRVLERVLRFLKQLAQLAMDVKRIPQSGSCKIKVDGRRLTLNVDLVPSQHGQALVIHLSSSAHGAGGLLTRVKRLLGGQSQATAPAADVARSSATALRAVLLTQTAEGSFVWAEGMAALMQGTDAAALRASVSNELQTLGTARPA
ncbi:MAG: Flp pilus assembly complex ATPase component TadA, partial [Planctomycetota bacterium]|nr:Flp pilus assembly complex ATPase component TadA [Planctomycetota bacterium]